MSADTTTPTPAKPAPIEDTDTSWPAMLNEFGRDLWRRFHRNRASDEWPPDWLAPAAAVAGVLLIALLLYGLIVPLIRWLASFTTDAVGDGAGWLRDWNLTHVVLDPVRSYLTAHSAGLPITAETLWWTWSVAGVGLFAFAFLWRAVAARLGWVLFGAATVAMVWATTTGPARTTTAGIAALWWIVLSLFALRRPWTQQRVTVHLPELPWLARILQRHE
ncbi:hypothetical protein [Micromonospora aurantiaca (nom. illeg.)]|uniref:hypothetical protein n=1 Tax=Micromonospora aurantiaca (nom. illeg.) TaxID=47850 RepID=UPI000828086E|nr:hypothetical protein [Micromonospora aurantiaca]SCL21335.1 hypothetical protein GA0070615_0046 [Micromonospora aurantiaca]SCL21472.1 hypothetical protein GA0070615_0080 [Micromonospora aurantiaca]SCL21529.1 hypothetical protein GA0070615_0092 [Micromonospora aurantiaca]SCL21535.1 hypothetical protein GA0070615_0093 [Micromonospora aurantiaca]